MFSIRDSIKAQSLSEALSLMQSMPNAVVVSGGTDVIPKIRAEQPEGLCLILIAGLQELKGIDVLDDMLVIGAGETFTNISQSQIVREYANAMSVAASLVGGHEIRNVATIGGNLCNGAVSAESAAPLLALDATLNIVGEGYEKTISIHDFYLAPGKTALVKGEILRSVQIPIREENTESTYIKFGRRRAMEISTLGCATAVTISFDRRQLTSVSIALTLAGPIPLRCRKAEDHLKGSEITASMIHSLGQVVKEEIAPRDSWRASKKYRIRLAMELSRRAVTEAIFLAGGRVNGQEC